ncbi:MAG TPA: bifunctional proline dehydrogenase/L-glutamate gamma-semialdehyde dehydrogenase PutA [Candidatus Cybelea sp.]|nr:bifunctional proline dehydrogenase/L-glutamate gamma-semialdehyde dehydrogenase PutA [Candidatus Cybelea sp.]
MVVADPLEFADPKRAEMRKAIRADETACVSHLLAEATVTAEARVRIQSAATSLVEAVRAESKGYGGLDAFLREYSLASPEGVVLMSLAEALLRIPDSATADRLIRDKIVSADWENHLGRSESIFVNASTWALMLTGRVLEPGELPAGSLGGIINRLIAKSGEPVIRQAIAQGMRLLGRQFVMGTDIGSALERAAEAESRGLRHSYDMLGEAARTLADAERYFDAYAGAISAIAGAAAARGPIAGPGISVKLSALDPRYDVASRAKVHTRLLPRLQSLAELAKAADIGLTIDAEEVDRLELSLDLLSRLIADPALAGWHGLGFAVQAYQKRAPHVLDWAIAEARAHGRRLMVRLVKGAYWDSEIKWAEVRGLEGYPVFTRKLATDVSYLACARRMLAAPDAIYPQFATHNAQTAASIMEFAGTSRDYEFQRLHGMGEALYDRILGTTGADVGCRIYAPVGTHKDLLAYLVRRLLENGANTSFVNRLSDASLPIGEVVADPGVVLAATEPKPHPRIPLPQDLFAPARRNSRGLDLADPVALARLAENMRRASGLTWRAGPIVDGALGEANTREVRDPSDNRRVIGKSADASSQDLDHALNVAHKAAGAWDATTATERAAILERASDLLESRMSDLMYLAVREAGKTLPDAVAEVREAIDYCRYYAERARADFAAPMRLPGPTGERNELALRGRGVFVCISPWNFPLAIFLGQITAALAAGNAVIAKPAEQTPLMATAAVRLLHEAGVPAAALHLLPGDGASIGQALIRDERVAGVAFTGGTDTAKAIQRSLADRSGPIVPLIAETGGQNAMIVDSSALPEQVVADAVQSAFGSTGQRCSALRVLFLQSDVADRVLDMLAGAMDELRGGDPALLSTDFGPVIDNDAKSNLDTHIARMQREARLVRAVTLPHDCINGTFVAPHAFEIDGIERLAGEVFGPVLHVIRFAADRLDQVIDAVNGTGFGLTLGIHTRIDERARHIASRVRAGNAYVNRGMIGAVVGSQPFGGEGLSGTGPKAGGPYYLHRFAVERVVSTDTTAAGGNATLVSLRET